MKIVSDVYSELGKALVGVGQAILIATVIAKFFYERADLMVDVYSRAVVEPCPDNLGTYFHSESSSSQESRGKQS